MPKPMLDPSEFNRVYQSELPVNVERVNKAVNRAHAQMALMTQPALASIDDVSSTVCDAWPKIRKVINLAMKFSWLIPGASAIAPMVKAFLTAVEKVLMPSLCGTKPE